MTTHGSAIAPEETPHETEATTNTPVIDILKHRAQAVLNNRAIDPQWRPIIRYGLAINDPWLPDILRRAESGERIIDSPDFSLDPANNSVGIKF